MRLRGSCTILIPIRIVRACQRRDWKDGKPRPHKHVCGKALTEDDLGSLPEIKDGVGAQDVFPEPALGYVRSAALTRQISALASDFWLDYQVRFEPRSWATD